MQLIVAPNLLQHVKHLSEISAVFELNHKSIFTPALLAAQKFLLHWTHWQINPTQNHNMEQKQAVFSVNMCVQNND